MTKKKIISLCLAATLVLGVAVAGTLAWLKDQTDEVVNTFTVGNIDITLEETTTDYKMVPGSDIDKDPVVTVEGGSEACYLFVEVTKSTDPALDDYIEYEIADGWTLLDGTTNIYYREVVASDDDQEFSVLKDDQVSVKVDVTKEMMDALETSGKNPTLTFKAYAVQKENIADAATAWNTVSSSNPSGPTGQEDDDDDIDTPDVDI